MSKVTIQMPEEINDIKYGDLFEWIGNCADDQRNAGVLLYSYNSLVSLQNPKITWTIKSSNSFIKENLASGELRRLPVGTIVTIEQE